MTRRNGMKFTASQKVLGAILFLVNFGLWVIPSDVVELIAKDRHTFLGRYSKTHFFWIVGMTIVSAVTIYINWSPPERARRRAFQVVAVLLFLTPALFVLDLSLRRADRLDYVRDRLAYRHPPNLRLRQTYLDRPGAARTYPKTVEGYPPVSCTLTTDARGFRNSSAVESADIIALGDSFTEGSGVSDEHPWPVLFQKLSGRTVYNLGMSGYDPLHYLASLEDFGLARQPKFVLCMVYEGNDFRSAKADGKARTPSLSKRIEVWFDRSPVLNAVESQAISVFGSLNSRGQVRGVEVLDWLPIGIPDGNRARHYVFAPKQLRDLMLDASEFAIDKHWLNPRGQLEQMREHCRKIGAELVVVFAPTKAHAIVPLVAERLPGEKVRAFLEMDFKGELPEAEAMVPTLLDRIDGRESVVRKWCEREGVAFISLTEPLREAIARGTQAFYTYDQHWTPEGHAVAAETIHGELGALLSTADINASSH